MSNVGFSYLYRDGGNYKKWGNVVFANPEQMNCAAAEANLLQALLEEGLFIAGQVRVPEVFLCSGGDLSLDDHCYHEFGGLGETDEEPSDAHGRTFSEFRAEVMRESGRGWRVFDPYDSEGSYGFLLAASTR